jgi:hypothetical protein
MSDCELIANCDGTGEGGCFIGCCDITCPPENPCSEIKIKYYCQPIGACCYPDSQNCSRTTQCQCEANGGTYEGDGTKCEPDNPCAKCVPPCDPNLCLECVPVECTPDQDLVSWCTDGSSPNNPCNGQAGTWIEDLTIESGCGTCRCPCATCTHICQNGQCTNVGPGNGNYNTEADCLADCGRPFFGGISAQAILRYECKTFCDPDTNEICCHGNCCAENSVCCNDGTCCAQGETCCYDQETDTYSCCAVGETCCHGNCCAVDRPVCCGDGTCCADGQTCCLDEGAGTYTCCEPGETCCGGTCCPAGNNCCTESNTSPPYCSPDPCPIPGCMNTNSPNFNPAATCDNGSCITCCNAGLCVVLDRDAAGNCNSVGNGCCDEFCLTANDCSPSYLGGSGQLPSCDRDDNGSPFQNEYTSCFSNDCVQGYLNPDVLAELEKNIENYNKSQFLIYNQYENEVFNQNNSPKYYQEIKEYNFSTLTSCACTCPQPFRYQGFLLNYEEDLRAMNAACSEYTITITTDYECGLTGGPTVSLAPCCCDGNFDTNTYTVSASSSGDCLEFEWDDTNIRIGESRTVTITVGEDCECVYCGTECVPFSAPFIKKLEGNTIKVSLDKKEIQKRLNSIRKKIIKKRKN